MNELNNAEVLVIQPPEPEGNEVKRKMGYRPGMGASEENSLFRKGVGFMLHVGVDIEFGQNDTFPSVPPEDVSKYKGIFVAVHDLPRLKSYFSEFEGVEEFQYESQKQWELFRHQSGSTVLMAFGWMTEDIYYNLVNIDKFIVEADLSVYSDALRKRMQSRSDEELLSAMTNQIMKVDRADWTDVMSYIARSLFGAWQVTKDQKILEYLEWLFDKAAATVTHRDGEVYLKSERPGTGIGFGITLSLDTLIHFYRVNPKPRYLVILENEMERSLRKEPYALTERWTPFPKGMHGLLAVASFFDKVDQIEELFLNYCQAGEEALYDVETGLWRYFVKNGRTSPNFPGHGCALSIMHLLIILDFYPKELRGYEIIVEMFRKLARGVARYQNEHGAWHTILDVPGSLERTDHTALFAHSFLKGYRNGLLDTEFRDRGLAAWNWLKTRLFQGGPIGTLGGITHAYTYQYYLFRPLYYDYLQVPAVSHLMADNEAMAEKSTART